MELAALIDLETVLRQRVPNMGLMDRKALASFVDKYDAPVKLTCFTTYGFRTWDSQRRSVAVYKAELREGLLHLPKPYTDIIVVTSGEPRMFLGWVTADKLKPADDRYLISAKSLSPMPEEFDFKQTCSHLSDWGGVRYGKGNWTCFGCGQEIVFSSVSPTQRR